MKEDETDDERRGFLKKVASVSIATAFGGLVAVTKAGAAQPPPTQASAPQQFFRKGQRGAPPNAQRPDGSDLEEGDLAQIAAKLNEHPDAAVRAVLKQTAMGLASNDGARADFEKDVHGSLRKLNIDLPAGLLPKQLRVPKGVHDAAAKRKGWGIGAGHSNSNYWTNHGNHNQHSDYTDWW
jgi:hypothetical protein